MKKIRFGIVAFAALCSINVFAQKTKIDVKKGQKYQLVTTSKVVSVASVMGQDMENTADNTVTTVYEVKDVEPAEIKLESTITHLKTDAVAMGQTTKYDSDRTDNEGPGIEDMGSMVNKKKTIKLDAKGIVTKEDAGSVEEETSGMLMGIGGNGNIELFAPALTGTELKAGDSFPRNEEIKGETLSTKSTGTYTIISVDNGIATVKYTGSVDLEGTMEQMGQEMTMKSTGKVSGDMKFDTVKGLVISSAMTTDSDMTIDAGGMTIPVKVKTTTSNIITSVQ